ncbi:MAG: hypothetical protein B6D45_06630 [Ignavibacteriales bacterium UTCHB3]|nr:MAG: hypothetical protein B6D45_06630 [Ignavibacteriales bacterium UTCHB3]
MRLLILLFSESLIVNCAFYGTCFSLIVILKFAFYRSSIPLETALKNFKICNHKFTIFQQKHKGEFMAPAALRLTGDKGNFAQLHFNKKRKKVN